MQVCLGGVAGAIALSLMSTAYHWLFFRPTLSDGQYGMVWMITLPAGGILGVATVYALAEHQSTPVPAGVACIIGFGLAAIPVGLYLWMTTRNSRNMGTLPIATCFESLVFELPTILWMGVLLVWSFRLLVQKAT